MGIQKDGSYDLSGSLPLVYDHFIVILVTKETYTSAVTIYIIIYLKLKPYKNTSTNNKSNGVTTEKARKPCET